MGVKEGQVKSRVFQGLDAIERNEKGLWRRVDKLIPGKTVKAYDEAIGVLKDLRGRRSTNNGGREFVRRVEAIRGRFRGSAACNGGLKTRNCLRDRSRCDVSF
jgi:hypothetical protein